MPTKLQYPTGRGDLQPRTGFHPASTSVEELAGVLHRYPNLRGRGLVDDGAGPGVNVDQFAAALAWTLANLRRRKAINRRCSSYTLKHHAESMVNRYISAGAMIAALVAAGFTVERCHPTSKNVWANVSIESVKALRSGGEVGR